MGKKRKTRKKPKRLKLGIFNLLALFQWPVAIVWSSAGFVLIITAMGMLGGEQRQSTAGMMLILALGAFLSAKFSANLGKILWNVPTMPFIVFKLSATNILICLLGSFTLWQALAGGHSLYLLVSFVLIMIATLLSYHVLLVWHNRPKLLSEAA